MEYLSNQDAKENYIAQISGRLLDVLFLDRTTDKNMIGQVIGIGLVFLALVPALLYMLNRFLVPLVVQTLMYVFWVIGVVIDAGFVLLISINNSSAVSVAISVLACYSLKEFCIKRVYTITESGVIA